MNRSPCSRNSASNPTAWLSAAIVGLALSWSSSQTLRAEPPAVAQVAASVSETPSSELPKYPPPADVRAAFIKLLDRPKVAADVKELSPPRTENGLTTEHLSIATEKKADGSFERVPMLIVRPEKVTGRLPLVIALHGTGGNKEGQRRLITELARHGIIGVAIDSRYHGERVPGARAPKPTSPQSPAPGALPPASRKSIRFITTPAGICGGRSII